MKGGKLLLPVLWSTKMIKHIRCAIYIAKVAASEDRSRTAHSELRLEQLLSSLIILLRFCFDGRPYLAPRTNLSPPGRGRRCCTVPFKFPFFYCSLCQFLLLRLTSPPFLLSPILPSPSLLCLCAIENNWFACFHLCWLHCSQNRRVEKKLFRTSVCRARHYFSVILP